MAALGANSEVIVTVHPNGGNWLCGMYFGRVVPKHHLLTSGCTKYIAINRMKGYAKQLGLPFPKHVPVT